MQAHEPSIAWLRAELAKGEHDHGELCRRGREEGLGAGPTLARALAELVAAGEAERDGEKVRKARGQ